MSLENFDLVSLVTKFNIGEENVCNYLMSKEERKFYNDFQMLAYLLRYSCYNETLTEFYQRCSKVIIKNTDKIQFEEIFRALFQQEIAFSGHRLLQYGFGNTEACLTCSFNDYPLALGKIGQWMKGHLSCGIEIIDQGLRKGLFPSLEQMTNIYAQPRTQAVRESTMMYRFNLIVNICSMDVLNVLEALMPTSRSSAVANLATISIIDDFIQAVKENGNWNLFKLDGRIATSEEYRKLKNPVETIKARTLMDKICKCILSVGKPSIIFLDAMNEKWETKLPFFEMGKRRITTTNLCCEIALPTLPNEEATCNIASVSMKNVTTFEEMFKRAHLLTRSMNSTILDSSYEYTRKFRPLGIGVLGAFECYLKFLENGNHRTAMEKMDNLFFGLYMGSLTASSEWAMENGNFEGFKEINYKEFPELVKLAKKAKENNVLAQFERSFKFRYNLTLTAQAPTANMAMFCNVSPSLEPCEHNYNLRANSAFLKINTKDCGMSLRKKSIISEELIKLFSKYCDQSISANAFLFDPEKLARLILKRRSYSTTGLYYCRNIKPSSTLLCSACSL